MSAVPERYIDFHAHLFPDDFFDAIRAFFRREYGLEVAHRLYARECIDFLRERGAGAVVYSNYAHRKGVARTLNEWNVALLDSNADLSCFAPFHPDDDDALAMARDILQHPQVLGFKLHFLVQPFRPDDERLFPLYELVMERGKRLLMHIGTGPIGNGHLGAAYLERILGRYPCLPANIAHMGAFEFDRFFSLLEGHPGLFLDTAFCFLPGKFRMYTLGPGPLEQYRDRLLYGSDFPNIFSRYDEEVAAFEAMGLSDEFYRKVFRDNGEALLKRPIPGL